MHRTHLLGAAAAVALVLGACGGGEDDSADDIEAELSNELQADGEGLPEEQADCLAAVLVEEIGAEELADIDLSAEAPPEELQDEFAAAAVIAVDTCDIDADALTG